MRLIVGISGATGSIYGIRLLEILKEKKIETHLILTSTAKKILLQETPYGIERVENLASHVYENEDLTASISSGSFKTDGMVVIPCSIKSLSGIAHSYNENLLMRAADVTLKERRKLILVVRETPLHQGHIQLMLQASQTGAILFPPMPAFYFHPKTIDDLINHTVGKVLDLFGINHHLFNRWGSSEVKKTLRKKGFKD
ncbi:MAG: 3-octaprenyl-4-hydroxybenzoate carboxy-lyase [Deltaproteobacteria bacterium CG_4_8_14_3_um_filter_45_9]|nr:MAG: 3-octaprenyl-4-hydroxybenzoate carboxy-lyase [Deltaproteobacteria bacterium CG03_land_8_20_14_0_80_45_14]PIX22809.1 MAG: 3-octaprenyl-4-hydroxybenzoate carboxy-lyase [Deltaproteobacteria bacterium CG_4_8_14_3_um_filter_45_9]